MDSDYPPPKSGPSESTKPLDFERYPTKIERKPEEIEWNLIPWVIDLLIRLVFILISLIWP